MARSERYRSLEAAVREVRTALLPTRFSATGIYRSPKRVHLHTASFCVLVHAEIEAFVEDRSTELLDAAWKRWVDDGHCGITLVSLLAYSATTTQLPPGQLGGDPENQRAYDKIHQPLGKAKGVWSYAVTQNHGIKEKNLLRLLLPLGVKADDLDPQLLTNLNSFGLDRGTFAHSSSHQVQNYLDPKTQNDRVKVLLTQLKELDELVSLMART